MFSKMCLQPTARYQSAQYFSAEKKTATPEMGGCLNSGLNRCGSSFPGLIRVAGRNPNSQNPQRVRRETVFPGGHGCIEGSDHIGVPLS